MKTLLKPAVAAALVWSTAAAAEPASKLIGHPDTYSANVIHLLARHDIERAAQVVTGSLGASSHMVALKNSLAPLKEKRLDYSDKVIDRTFGKSLRQIVYYAYFANAGFLYFRFNFKRTSQGWLLSNFNFKTEDDDLFPPGFVDPPVRTVAHGGDHK